MTASYPRFPIDPKPAVPSPRDPSTGAAAVFTKRGGLYRHVFKRVFDLAAVLVAAPIILPLVAVLAIIVAREGGAPFYSQLRVGRGGRVFRMWKLRSMVTDADRLLAAHLVANPCAQREWDDTQKLQADPRVTRFGALLRKTSLDELPQLWNVLVGDMSLVGPRPMMICQQAIYPSGAYYALRPGITGSWQISGRSRTSFAARADFDTAYEADLSLPTDLRILVGTVSTVLSCTGV